VGVLTAVFNTLIVLASIFLICLILIQRGKGGGLAGAFGGVGGSSAFGTKAGDTFTKITVVTAAVWMLIAMLLVVMTNRKPTQVFGAAEPAAGASKEPGSSGSKTKSSASGSAPASSSSTPAEAPSGAVPAIPPEAPLPATPGSDSKK
jgi:preprotein translocase subunit SecG